MKDYLSGLHKELLEIAQYIGYQADQQKIPAYVVGGIVRDLILKRRNFDLDIVLEGNAVMFARHMAKKIRATLTTYPQFYTATLKFPNGLRVDLATARKEHYPHPGALPVVQPGMLRDDLFRRDFTINAMAICLNRERVGQLIDDFQGLKDIKKRYIRILHSQSFIDDPTRILRAVRFEGRFLFRLELTTLMLLKEAIQQKVEKTVKLPRYFEEFKKILKEDTPSHGLRRLQAFKALTFIHPGIRVRFHLLNQLESRIKVLQKRSLFQGIKNGWLFYFMALLEGLGHSQWDAVIQGFPLTREERRTIGQCQQRRAIIRQLFSQRKKRSQVYKVLSPLTKETVLYMRMRTQNQRVGVYLDRFLEYDAHVQLCLTGDDLIRMGIHSGRRIGEILQRVLEEKIDKNFRTSKEERQFASTLSDKFL